MALQDETAAVLSSWGLSCASALAYSAMERIADKYGLDCGVEAGAGWTSQAAMLSLVEAGFVDILYAQTFTCLSNHVSGSALFRTIREEHPQANLAQVEYDTGISQVNQINRIKLLAALAKSRR